jgi:hypothetical protein
MDLLATAANDQEKALVAIVALVSVERDQRYLGVSENKLDFMRRCHRYLESVLLELNAQQTPLLVGMG